MVNELGVWMEVSEVNCALFRFFSFLLAQDLNR